MNVGDTVYVRWYGDVVKGEIAAYETDNQLLGTMIAVRIPLQGMHATALFFPEHVHQTAEEVMEQLEEKEKPINFLVQPDNVSEDNIIEISSVEQFPNNNWDALVAFKESHWDHEHNHLQVEALDEFYELWKEYSKPILNIPKLLDADMDKMAEEFSKYDGVLFVDTEPTIMLEPNQEPVSQNDTPSDKPKKSNPTVIQLSLFD